jgi:hypothetical protein
MGSLPTPAARYVYLLLAMAVWCALPSMVAGQERPFDTTACALTQHPDRYNEGLVSVEGLITVGPEEFMLHDANCGDEHGKIWLEFGGGVESPGGSPAAHSTKNRPKTFESLQLPLNQDRDFNALQKLLQDAQKSGKTKMLHATLIGKYFAGKPTPTVTGVIRAGYGRLGCCSLLIIEEVGTVEPDIEEPVDFSPVSKVGPKTLAKGCTIVELTVPPREDEDQLERKSLKDEYQYLHDPKKVAARAISVQDPTSAEDIEKQLQTDSPTSSLASYTWASTSADATTSYHIVVNRPYWLLGTAISGDAVIWVPKSITKTECTNAHAPTKNPFPH